jgi:hypothetical protein
VNAPRAPTSGLGSSLAGCDPELLLGRLSAPRHYQPDQRDIDRDAPDRHAGRIPEQRHRGLYDELARDDELEQHGEHAHVVHDERRVDQRADRDEEERDERVAQRQEARQRLVRVFGIADQ